jgi:hypothetical protein
MARLDPKVVAQVSAPAQVIRMRGRNDGFALDRVNVFGSEHNMFVDFLAKKSREKNPPAWISGPAEEIAAMLETLAARIREEVRYPHDRRGEPAWRKPDA